MWQRPNHLNFPYAVRREMQQVRFKCGYCSKRFTEGDPGELDHCIPLSAGGRNTKSNAIWSCRDCHHKKTVKERQAGAKRARERKKEKAKDDLEAKGVRNLDRIINRSRIS